MKKRVFLLAVLAATIVFSLDMAAERIGYPPAEFAARRQALAKAVGTGTVVLFGRTEPQAGIRFRQDNDFYYFTGNEDLNAAMVMNAATQAATLFLPRQTAGEIRTGGKNLLESGADPKSLGFAAIQPLDALPAVLSRITGSPEPVLWLRLQSGDEADVNRGEHATNLARRLANVGGTYLGEDANRVAYFRAQFPALQMKDVTPHIDRLRTVKSPREIEIMRANGRISAEAFRRAILSTRENGFEYEIEAEATYWMFRNGIQGNSFAPIVGTGPNVNIWHYDRNGRQYKDGDLVVMDYGGALDYLGVDITRTWPVAGKFDDYQLRAYQCSLEAEKSIIAAMKVGATRAQTREIGNAVYKKYGFPGGAGAGHYVGMFRNGIQGNSFAPIVGTGPNVNIWHYDRNGRQYKDGDLVVMDYGGALDYLGIDITRTWPVAGKFDDYQLRAYQCSLEAEKSIIAAMKVGATRAQTREIGNAVYKKYGFPGGAGAGHYVGMSVHDVGDSSLPFSPGMTIAVEPIVEDASKQLHVRIEDTVLITENGPEILTSGVPKEVDAILALVQQARARKTSSR